MTFDSCKNLCQVADSEGFFFWQAYKKFFSRLLGKFSINTGNFFS